MRLPFVVRPGVGSLVCAGLLLGLPLLAQCPGGYGGGGGGAAGGPASAGPSGPSGPGPTSPGTPGPAGPGPSTPTGGPEGPRTGGPGGGSAAPPTAGPAAPRLGGPAAPGRRGAAMVFTHGETTKKLLEIDWDYPVYEAPAAAGQHTSAAAARRALPAAEALRHIAGDDPRPLLVLRECWKCQGSDVALLSREMANERTQLLTDWFHCVKLPANVAEANHPFHELFPDGSHLFFCQADGSMRTGLDGMQTQTQLWKAMSGQLSAAYEGSHEPPLKELVQLLAQFDIVDDKEARKLAELDRELERTAKSPRVSKLQAELQAIGAERQKLLARERELRNLKLKQSAGKGETPAAAPIR